MLQAPVSCVAVVPSTRSIKEAASGKIWWFELENLSHSMKPQITPANQLYPPWLNLRCANLQNTLQMISISRFHKTFPQSPFRLHGLPRWVPASWASVLNLVEMRRKKEWRNEGMKEWRKPLTFGKSEIGRLCLNHFCAVLWGVDTGAGTANGFPVSLEESEATSLTTVLQHLEMSKFSKLLHKFLCSVTSEMPPWIPRTHLGEASLISSKP